MLRGPLSNFVRICQKPSQKIDSWPQLTSKMIDINDKVNFKDSLFFHKYIYFHSFFLSGGEVAAFCSFFSELQNCNPNQPECHLDVLYLQPHCRVFYSHCYAIREEATQKDCSIHGRVIYICR